MEKPTSSEKAIKVFYSYAHEDESFRKDLEKHLSMLRRRGVISEWHDRNITAGANWEQEVDHYLDTAHLILFLVSSDFLYSDYCYGKEMQRALERNALGDAAVVPVLVRSVSWEGAPFSHLQVIPRDNIPVKSTKWDQDEAWTHVVKELRDVIATMRVVESEADPFSDTRHLSRIFDMPHPRNPFFTGREDILQQLHASFAPGNSVALTQSIGGLGGIGKTQIAIEYAFRFQQQYRYVFWINADTSESLQSGFINVASLLRLPLPSEGINTNITMNALREWFNDNEHWLLILDNADDLNLLSSYQLLLHSNKGHILITTRATATGGLTARTMSIEPMVKEDAGLLLLRRAKVLTPEATLEQASGKIRKEAEAIIAILDGLPLALDQAGAYLEETGSSLTNYVSLYQQRHFELLNERGRFAPGHPQSVATTWSLSFQLVEQTNPAAAELLRFCAFLQPDAIPIDMLIIGCSYLGPVLEPVASDPFTLNRAIGELLKFSLVKRSPDRQHLQLHRLVQTVLRDTMDTQIQTTWMEQVIQVLEKACVQLKTEHWEQCQPYVLQAQHLLVVINDYSIISSEVAVVFTLAGRWLSTYLYYREAEPFYKQALQINEQLLGPEHPTTAASCNHLAVIYQDLGRYGEAEPLYERALQIREQALGPEHPDTATSLNNLAFFYQAQGKYEEARPLHERALQIYEQVLGSEHPNTATSLNNLARTYQAQGRHGEARPLHERALQIREQVLGSEHPHTAISFHNLAHIYQAQGKYEEAKSLYERTLRIEKQVLGDKHPRITTSLHSLANLYQAQGRHEEAESLHERALQIREQVLGSEHPHTAISLSNLASLYQDQGRYVEAEPLLERALQIREQVLGPEHPSTRTVKETYLLIKQMVSDRNQNIDS